MPVARIWSRSPKGERRLSYIRGSGLLRLALLGGLAVTCVTDANGQAPRGLKGEQEEYVAEPMPAGFQVVINEFEGPVFADANGRTLYTWPGIALRNGLAGEQKDKPACGEDKYTETSGLMSPYPPGMVLPQVETRPVCSEVWPPVIAQQNAQALGKWTIVRRKDGVAQWAYDGFALYTSNLDTKPGDVLGATKQARGSTFGAVREPVGPAPNIPAQFAVHQVATGRLLTTKTGYSVYAFKNDTRSVSRCQDKCLEEWSPVLAPARVVSPARDWAVLERTPGVNQWVYRGKPLYTRNNDRRPRSVEGAEEAGWENVYTMPAPSPPKEFTQQDTRGGIVLADRNGMTLYVYYCNDDALDQLACDHPNTPHDYRLAVCGRGDPARCAQTFPYAVADESARSPNDTWTIMQIDPKSGRRAEEGSKDALRVWAYRDRPVFLHFRDKKPGDVEGDAWGEFEGRRNGYKAFWLTEYPGSAA